MKKKLFASLILSIFSMGIGYCQVIDAFLNDNDGQYTNIRNAPNGTIVGKIPTSHSVEFILKTPKNGWWRIDGDDYYDFDLDKGVELKPLKAGNWIHYSCLGVDTRNYGGERLYLRVTPSPKGKVVCSFSEEVVLRPIDIKGDWVKVSYGKNTGWIHSKWLCGNPVTNCN